MAQKPSARLGGKRSILSRIVRRIILGIYHLKGCKIDGGVPKDVRK